jgi:hypothetical protein
LLSAAALLAPSHRAGWPVLFGVHLLGAVLLLGIGPLAGPARFFAARFPRAHNFIADWYPLLMVPALYTELAGLNASVWNGTYFDSVIQHWEALLFGGQPSRELAARFPDPLISEPLHAGYLSYYFIIYIPAIVLYARGRLTEFRTTCSSSISRCRAHATCFPRRAARWLMHRSTS